jgi:acetyl-CoA acetyltransferase
MRMAALQSFSRKAAIVGVGYTEITRNSGRSVLELALDAIHAALGRAELEPAAIDGFITYSYGDSVAVRTVARALGLRSYRWNLDILGGGSQAPSTLAEAAMAIEAGLAEVIVVFRALNGRTGVRMGQIQSGTGDGNEQQFNWPYGQLGPVTTNAMVAQRYLHDRNLGSEDLALLAVHQRAKAVTNPKALLRQPMTVEDYFDAPLISTPFRRPDCCLETDAACALIITGSSRARQISRRPVYVHAAVRAGGKGIDAIDKGGEHGFEIFSRYVAPELYRAAGMTKRNIDLAQLYDAYSYLIIKQLEDFGFCDPADFSDRLRSGYFARNGELPLNMNGGLLHEGYVHGINNIVEAVEQLQGQAGDRQVSGVATALCTGFGGSFGSAAILSVEA